MPAKTRDPRWDNAKFFLIYLVIVGHIMEPFCDEFAFARSIFFFIYSFHMPAFLFISGLFSNRTVESEQYRWKKLLPYLLVCFFLNFYRSVSLWIYNPHHHFHFDDQNNISWFLMALFACYNIAWLLRKFNHRYMLLFSILIALVAGYDTHIGSTFAIARIINFFPFFYAGYLLDRDKLAAFLDRKNFRIFSGCFMAAYLIICIALSHYVYAFRPLVTGQNSYDDAPFGMQPYTWIFRLVYYAGAMLLILCFCSLVPRKNIRYISTWGQRTLAVYFWHLPFVTFVTRAPFIESFAGSHLWFEVLLALLYAAVLVVIFSQRCFTVPLEYMMMPDKFEKKSK